MLCLVPAGIHALSLERKAAEESPAVTTATSFTCVTYTAEHALTHPHLKSTPLCCTTQAAGRPPSPIHGLNPWPDQIPGFGDALKTYISCMQGLGAAILHGIAMGLQLQPDTFGGSFAGPGSSYWVRGRVE